MSALLDGARVWPDQASPAPAEAPFPPPDSTFSIESVVRSIAEMDKTAAVEPETTIGDIWKYPEAHPLILTLLLLDKYGAEYLDWHPEVLRVTMERDGVTPSNRSWNKIMAARVLFESPSPWRQWEVFHWVCRALNGETPNFSFYEMAEISHLVSGFESMKLVDPKRETNIEIDKFVAAIFKSEGIPYIPAPLDFAQRELEQPKIECTTCGAIHRDDNDTKCITCGEATLHKLPYEFESQKNECKDLFEARHKLTLEQAVDGLPDTGTGSAVYRLLVEWDAARTARTHLHQQLRLIGGR